MHTSTDTQQKFEVPIEQIKEVKTFWTDKLHFQLAHEEIR